MADRNFLSPKIYDYTDNTVLLSFRTTAASDSPVQLQLIDKDGNILFTYPIEKSFGSINNAIILPNQVQVSFIRDNAIIIPLDKNLPIKKITSK